MAKVLPNTKFAVWKRDGLRCRYCGVTCFMPRPGGDNSPLMATVDHVQPRSKGGSNGKHNLVTACFSCNLAKGSLSVAEFKAVVASPRRYDIVSGAPAMELARQIVREQSTG